MPTSPKRTDRILLRVTPDEKAAITQNAADAGVGVSRFLRAVGVGQKLAARRPSANDAAIRQLALIGNNVNQIAKRVNAGSPVDPTLLDTALRELLAAIRQLE